MLKENGITINFRQEEPVYIYADEFYIDQAVTNYFTNAIKHAEEKNGKKEIEIRIEKLKDENNQFVKLDISIEMKEKLVKQQKNAYMLKKCI